MEALLAFSRSRSALHATVVTERQITHGTHTALFMRDSTRAPQPSTGGRSRPTACLLLLLWSLCLPGTEGRVTAAEQPLQGVTPVGYHEGGWTYAQFPNPTKVNYNNARCLYASGPTGNHSDLGRGRTPNQQPGNPTTQPHADAPTALTDDRKGRRSFALQTTPTPRGLTPSCATPTGSSRRKATSSACTAWCLVAPCLQWWGGGGILWCVA